MKFFHDYTLKWYDTSILKVTMVAFGMYVALKWPEAVASLETPALVVFLVGAVYLLVALRKQMLS